MATQPVAGTATPAAPPTRRGAIYFDCSQAEDVLVEGLGTRLKLPPRIPSAIDPEAFFHHKIWKQPLVRAGTHCLSGFYIAPYVTIPRHSSPGNYMAWVWEGSLRHSSGGRMLKHGAGFFARAGAPYAFTTGPTGARILVFGRSDAVPEDLLDGSTVFTDDPREWQRPVADDSAAHGTVFFDWSDTPQYLYEHVEERNASIPAAVTSKVDVEEFFRGWFWGQPLPRDDATDLRPGSYYQAPNSYLPRHRHMNECIYFVTEGALVQGNRVSRPGSGWYGPPANPYVVGAGPCGVRMMELHLEGELTAVDDPLPPGIRTLYLEDDPRRWVAPPLEMMHPDPLTTTFLYRDLQVMAGRTEEDSDSAV